MVREKDPGKEALKDWSVWCNFCFCMWACANVSVLWSGICYTTHPDDLQSAESSDGTMPMLSITQCCCSIAAHERGTYHTHALSSSLPKSLFPSWNAASLPLLLHPSTFSWPHKRDPPYHLSSIPFFCLQPKNKSTPLSYIGRCCSGTVFIYE